MNDTDQTTALDPDRPGDAHLLRQTAYDRIEVLLDRGELAPGRLVSQRELVQMTGSSLGSIREAIPRLEAEGLLQTLPKRGLMIPSLDVSFVRDAYGLRRRLELGAVEAAYRNLPRETLLHWLTRHEALTSEVRDDRSEVKSKEVQDLDWAMHKQMIAADHNGLVDNVYRTTAIKIRMAVQSRIKVTPFNAERVIREHLAFLRPLAEGDLVEARAALARHVDNSLTLALGGTLDDQRPG
ncbi:GntR family transcriptional regulator [Pseudoroseicyclus aestuarii]|uniref:GntR family transcriptional regulator n=1 Tax=Pseudoroseicyclus aestuarii TaxID=1795041 RepID=A0A318SSI6_9RHOB|nr:GntR family transcriptional regulator [Pseudoroseicyclus aestuarii]PYE84901.1 GntR family transcriptional regulator [Pseudoroseicyclus aestuarii]